MPQTGDLIRPSKLANVNKNVAFAAIAVSVYIHLHTLILIEVIFPCSKVVASHSLLQNTVYIDDKVEGSSFLAAILYVRKRYNK